MNLVLFYIYNVVWYFLALLLNGAVLQTFLLEYGVSEEMVNIYCSVMQVVQSITMLATAKWLDRQKKVLRVAAYMLMPNVLMLALLLYMCFWKNMAMSTAVLAVFSVGFVVNVFFALGITLAYKIPYHIMDMRQYAVVISISGVFLNLANILCTGSISFFQRWFSYSGVMVVLLVLGLLSVPTGMFVLFRMKETGDFEKLEKKEKKKVGNVFKYRPFQRLFPADLLRGFSMGASSLLVTIGYYQGILDVKSASFYATLTFVMAFLQCLTYPFLSKKIGERRLIFYFSILVAILLPLILMGKTTTWFLAVSVIFQYIINVVANAIPVAVTKIVDYEIMGEYSSWRLFLNTIGTAIGGLFCIPLMKILGAIGALSVYGACQLVTGVVYARYMKKYVKTDGE